ncbi:uncharacterized protein MELLADRAFT_93703 [Melampsora larici-populina 98AG31]|uniref:Cytochrome P450 monooxygenase n=1 Tax=Melampsora larici-populina (strain 98AG31 / pathotype 3-4-7) TaxID=747676 RepID=F4S4Z2_MELLP|nr:uncharacterized protein MELLADRAFT_93703 [Melampsora larici-populina 98AG31]EGG00296.1 hypothetical protein MELLADRAFT_93703 [Melampsora larici-populina 98AG31]
MSSTDFHSNHYPDSYVPFNGVGRCVEHRGSCLPALRQTSHLTPFSASGPTEREYTFWKPGRGRGVRQWHKDFGPTLRFRGMFGRVQLSTIDPKALNHILISRAYAYPKPDTIRRGLGGVLGHGLIFAEGETHKRQKRLLGPTFSPVQIRELAPVVYKYTYLLRDKWADIIRSSQEPYVVINVHAWLSRATLDIIGSAGFGYHFGALEGDMNSSEMGKAFHYLISYLYDRRLSSKSRTPPKMLRDNILQSIPSSLRLYKPISMKLIEESLKTLERESSAVFSKKRKEAEAGGVLGDKDLISVLLRANVMAEGKECLRDEEVIGQVCRIYWSISFNQSRLTHHLAWNSTQNQMTTFLLAGHETTATALTWLLWTLAKHPDVQKRLRRELQEARVVTSDAPSIDLNFGPDADVFRPDRWLEKGQVNALPGFWSGLMTFLGGPRACIGYRFSLMELKVILAVIICHFHFDERNGLGCGPEFEGRINVVMRPQVKGEKRGLSMPLRVGLVEVP